jgi:hypothetical protein
MLFQNMMEYRCSIGFFETGQRIVIVAQLLHESMTARSANQAGLCLQGFKLSLVQHWQVHLATPAPNNLEHVPPPHPTGIAGSSPPCRHLAFAKRRIGNLPR